MNPPLHTNATKKIVFVFAFLASSYFNVRLFLSMGIVWAIVGQATVFFQTVELRNFFNTKKTTRYFHLSVYSLCLAASIAGTIGAGFAEIEKSRPTIKLVELENDKKFINKMLESEDLNQWAGLNYLNKRNKLDKKTIEIKKSEKKITSSLNGIAKLFKVPSEMVAFIFLIFVAVIIELMIFVSATFNGKLFSLAKKNKTSFIKKKKLTKLEKELKAGQLILKMEKFG